MEGRPSRWLKIGSICLWRSATLLLSAATPNENFNMNQLANKKAGQGIQSSTGQTLHRSHHHRHSNGIEAITIPTTYEEAIG
jgi:hypothetical protein